MKDISEQTVNRRAFLYTLGIGSVSLAANCSPSRTPHQGRQTAEIPLRILTEDPLNAEPVLSELVDSWITPVDRFYIRSHAPTPEIDPSRFRLTVEGMVKEPLSLSLSDMEDRFERVQMTATLTCAGNRRSEHSKLRSISGVQWGRGAIGNAQWSGFRLSDVLKAAGLHDQASHVWFEGLDEIRRDNAVIAFGGSIPLQRALDLQSGALLAVEMNGAPLEPDHGFPVRSFVPGVIGARSVKWLGRILVSDRPSANHYVRRAYKIVKTGEENEWDQAQPIQEFPLNSAICVPGENAAVEAGTLIVRGYALAPGDFEVFIDRAELSVDQGKTWTRAEWTSEAHPFCWRLWRGQVAVNSGTRSVIVRAVDSRGEEQPQTVEWNLKGYLFNAWDRVPLEVT